METSVERDGERLGVVDACGLYCPVPLLRLRRRLSTVSPGLTVLLLATDATVGRDIADFCRREGHDYLGRHDRPGGVIEFAVRAGVSGPFPR